MERGVGLERKGKEGGPLPQSQNFFKNFSHPFPKFLQKLLACPPTKIFIPKLLPSLSYTHKP
jgi:hypothetical protein